MTQDNPTRLVEQLRPFLRDDEACGRVYADVHDLMEICTWFLQRMNVSAAERLSREDIEDLLIELDVRLVDHGSFHLKSLKKEIRFALGKLSENSADDKNIRGVA